MKKVIFGIISVLILTGLILTSCNDNKADGQKDKPVTKKQNSMMHNMQSVKDTRISLNVPPQMAQHQLMNMRNHVKAVHSILDYLSKDEFEKASEVASSKLGLTKEMKMMCSAFGNKDFEKMGLEFHKSADKMSEVFKTKDKNKSLAALSTTMNYCVSCHATFKQ